MDRGDQSVLDSGFTEITRFLKAQDLLVFNNTRVIAARLFGKTESGGEVEVLRITQAGPSSWWCMARPLKKFKAGAKLLFDFGLRADVVERRGEMEVLLNFKCDGPDINSALEKNGLMPIPPYIRGGHGDETDRADYQSIFAEFSGSVAAPTASLHFTPDLVARIKAQGTKIAQVTLHVGPASFLPLWRPGQDSEVRPPSAEMCIYSAALLDQIKLTKERGGRVIAVGTTVVRALESMSRSSDLKDHQLFETALFIYPGYKFQVVDSMVTNFHQPQSTHLLLVESFMGRDLLGRSYTHALEHEYRFLSYGDGMIIL